MSLRLLLVLYSVWWRFSFTHTLKQNTLNLSILISVGSSAPITKQRWVWMNTKKRSDEMKEEGGHFVLMWKALLSYLSLVRYTVTALGKHEWKTQSRHKQDTKATNRSGEGEKDGSVFTIITDWPLTQSTEESPTGFKPRKQAGQSRVHHLSIPPLTTSPPILFSQGRHYRRLLKVRVRGTATRPHLVCNV